MSSSPASAAFDLDPRARANRANAQLSTGPGTEEGKAVSRLNAVKTALTGRTVLLPTDDAAAYEQHIAAYQQEFEPASARESQLVQTIADTDWRLSRIPALEMAIYARGSVEFAHLFDIHPADLRPSLIQLETFLKYEKQLRNLQLQESRLRSQREKTQAELRLLQRERLKNEQEQLADAAMLYIAAQHDGQPFQPADHGFEFSIEEIEGYIKASRAAQLFRASLKAAA